MKNFLFVLVPLIFAGAASGGAILTVGSPFDLETVGNLVTLDVTISSLPTTLDSYKFDVAFTPGVLFAAGSSNGSGTIDNVGGTISGLTAKNLGLNFGGTLFKIYFNAIGPGNGFLSIPALSVTLLDSAGNEIPFTTAGGTVLVDGAAPITTPEPSSLWLTPIGILALGTWHRKKRRAVLN